LCHNSKFDEKILAFFEKPNALNVSGFRTVFIEVNGVYHKIGSAYMPFTPLENNFLTIKNKM
jgi:hypothetical protein